MIRLNNKYLKIPILFTGFVILIILSFFFELEPRYKFNINITATSDKNSNALSNNIRIKEISIDNIPQDLENISLKNEWFFYEEDKTIVAFDNNNANKLTIPIKCSSKVSITFIKEIGSGIVDIRIDDINTKIDLYSNDWGYETFQYKIPIIKIISFYIFCYIIIYLFLLILFNLIILNYKKNNISFFKKIKYSIKVMVMVIISYFCISTLLIPFDNISKDITLEITSLATKNKLALSNNVRIWEIIVNNKPINLYELKKMGNWNVEDTMYQSMNSSSPSTMILNLENVKSLSVKFVKEVGAGNVSINISDGTNEILDLYDNIEWGYYTYNYHSNKIFYLYFLENRSLFIGITLLIFLFVYFLLSLLEPKICLKLSNYSSQIIFVFLLSLICVFYVSVIQYNGIGRAIIWINTYFIEFLRGLTFILLIILLLKTLIGYRIAYYITSISLICIAIINYYKLQYRGTPIFPWDFTLIKDLTSIASDLKLHIPQSFIVVFIIYLVSIFAIHKFNVKYHCINCKVKSMLFIMFAVLLLFYYKTSFLNGKVINTYEADVYYKENGLITAFIDNTQFLYKAKAPDNYDKEKVIEIVDELTDSLKVKSNKINIKPNIIMIMSESFWDITRINNIQFYDEVFPTINYLKNSAISGEILTNVFGGGTVNTEFEALTGFSTAFLPLDRTPYLDNIRKGFFSIPNFLKSLGYDTQAIHPYNAQNYNRSSAYPLIGFDEFLSINDFDEDAERVRDFISDNELTQKIINQYEEHKKESSNPWFNFTVTMQNHGGYMYSKLNNETEISFTLKNNETLDMGSTKDFVAGLHASDEALNKLINYFKSISEPTIIIFFGDHMTDPIENNKKSLFELTGFLDGLNTDEKFYEEHLTPIVAWSNYKEIKLNMGTIGANYIFPYIVQIFDLESNKYFEYLNKTREKIPAYTSGIVVNQDGSISNPIQGEQTRALYIQELLQYDYIFGKGYSYYLFEY